VQIIRPDSGSQDPKASRHTISAPTLREALQQAAAWTWPVVLRRRPASFCAGEWVAMRTPGATWWLRSVSGHEYCANWKTKKAAMDFAQCAEQAAKRMQEEWDADPATQITRTGVEGVDFIYQH